jgi:nucleotide-binding universal stress UspA family protein
MRRFLHPFLALLVSLLLVSGQQAAIAHMVGHAAGSSAAGLATDVAHGEDADHNAALTLSHVCTTCIAFAGVDVAPPAPVLPFATAAGRVAAPAVAVPPAPTLRFSAAFRSRAPPLL